MNAPRSIPALKDLCVQVVALNFEENPTFGQLPEKYIRKITNILALDLPLELVGSLINDEDYWKRRCNARWKSLEPSAHGNSYKQMYFERNLQDAIEQYTPSMTSENDLRRLMTYSRRFVQTLNLRQLPSHMDLGIVFDCMVSSPSSLSVHYNLQNVGMEYDRSLFGMKLADCRNLAKALESNETLTYLDVSNNGLDDDKVRMLASGLVENMSITHLNISHNKVADRGMRALAKLLDMRSVIAVLELQDNQIHTEGAKSLARVLKTNQALTSLNLRLNRMGDEGCKVVCEALKTNPSLGSLNLAANSAGKNAVSALAAMVRLNKTLTQLDVSCNSGFGPDGCEQLRRAVENNSSLMLCDMRQCGADPDDAFAVSAAIECWQQLSAEMCGGI
ncbi:flagellar associated protein [Dunaliella salina]|uniref:Flagellar associated protein n=1 Tax=Dunaliella salina TaxID=3046 RepID=A0ABQ7GFI8_DUNSA|nr:flagellar associated protein [Dunaliella salina]|eukprot:KAF5833356.1 flagellar associated protein [Dunaliella salina]